MLLLEQDKYTSNYNAVTNYILEYRRPTIMIVVLNKLLLQVVFLM